MGKNMKDVHPDRSGSMRDYPAITHHDGQGSSKSIRDTPEGRRIAKEGSKTPRR